MLENEYLHDPEWDTPTKQARSKILIQAISDIYVHNVIGYGTRGFESDGSEYERVADWLQGRTFRNCIEIGSAWGASFHLWSMYTVGKKISVDLPQHFPNVGNFNKRNAYWNSYFGEVYPVEGNSHQQETVDQVAAILDGELVDFLYIDADHSYQGCLTDYTMWKHFVRPGGYIGFHDVLAPHTPGSRQVWDELTAHLPEDKYHLCPGSAGIGIIQV